MYLSPSEKKMVSIFNDSRAQFVFFATLLYIICVFEYKHFVIGKYEYMGFRDNFNLFKSLIAGLVFITSVFVVYLRSSYFIKGFSALLIVLFLLPILVVFQYDKGGGVFVSATLLMIAIINLHFTFPLFRITKLKQIQVVYILCGLIIVLFLPFLLSYKINLNPDIFLLGEEVYVIRAAIKDHGNIFTSYFLSPIVQVLLPVLAIYGLALRKYYMTLLAVVCTIIMYMMIPQKSIFLGIFVVLFFYFFKEPIRKVSVFTFLVVSILIIGTLLSAFQDQLLLESLVLRRYLVIPAYLNHIYYEFFADAPLFYSHSFLKSFFHYPYEVGPTFLIGKEAFGNIETNANNGFMSDAYMNLEGSGVYFFTVIVSMLIKFFDRLSIDAKFFGLFFLLINLLRSSALPTIIITHGIWLLVLVGIIFLKDTKYSLSK